jgi:hypothetical protein
MSRIRRWLAAIVIPAVVMGGMAAGALSAPAVADTGMGHLQILLTNVEFTSFTCLNDSCTLAQSDVVGDATSNLSGKGSFQGVLTVDLSPGGTCNIVDESDVFTFADGTISIQSHHEDCATHGLRIDTTFQVTGGTGAFAGATGSGREFGATAAGASAANPIIYAGTISL